MTAPPKNLMDWPKEQLAAEVERLRKIMHEKAWPVGDVPRSGGDVSGGTDDPRGKGTVLIDSRQSVLLDAMDVSLVDTKRDEGVAMTMLLQGRVNFGQPDERSKQLYLMSADGAAALVSEIVGLAKRAADMGEQHGMMFAAAFQVALEDRMRAMP